MERDQAVGSVSGTFDDLEVIEGERQFDFPCVVIDADFARKALAANELPLYVHQALKAMELSGRRVAILKEAENDD